MLDFSRSDGQIEVYQSIPEEFKKNYIAGAIPIHVKADFAKFLFQKIECDGFDIWASRGNASGNGHMRSSGASALELRIGQEGQLEGDLDGIPGAGLLPYFCNLTYVPGIETDAIFRKGRQYAWLDVQFQESYLLKFEEKHPQFKFFLDAIRQKQPLQLGRKDFPCNVRMKRIINKIVYSLYHTDLRKDSLNRLVTALLEEVFTMAFYDGKPQPSILKHVEQEQVIKVYSHIMEADVSTPLSNPELCKKFNITKAVLLQGFRELCNTSPWQLTLDCRFVEAERLLLLGHSPEEVANATGYKRSTSFYPEFQRRYNRTPKEFQKAEGEEKL